MPILMSDVYAGQKGYYDTQNARQKMQEDQINLAELMRVRNDEAAARAIKTKIANQALEEQARPQYVPPAVGEGQGLVAKMPPSNVPGDFVPQYPEGMIPQEGFTGLGGMSTPQQGPMGMQPQEGATGLGGMQPMGMTPEQAPVRQPQQEQQGPAQGTLMSAFDNSEVVVSQAVAKVDQVKQAVMEMRKAGLHDEADRYEMKSYKLKEAADDAQKTHLELAEKLADYAGSQASGYLEAIDNPANNPEAAWQRMLLNLSANGVDIDEEMALPPGERQAYAEQTRKAAVSSKDQIMLQKAILSESGKQKRAELADETKKAIAQKTDERMAKNRELTQTRWERQFGLSEYKTKEKAIRDELSVDQRNTIEYDKQIAAVQKQIDDINSLRNLSVKKSERPAVIAELEAQKEVLVRSRDQAFKNVASYQDTLQAMHKSFANSGYKAKDLETPTEVAPSAQPAPSASPAAALKSGVDLTTAVSEAQAAIQAGAPEAEVARRFKEKHGVDFNTAMTNPVGAEPSAAKAKPENTKAMSAPQLSPEAQRKADLDKLFLEKLNGTTVWEDIKDFGSGIKKSTNAFETYFQNKADSFNADVDSLAAMAQEKLQDKTFVSKLSPRALKNLKEMASDTGASHKAYQESQTPFELPFLGSATSSAKALGGRMASNKATKDLVSTATKANSGPALTANMNALKQTLLRLSEKERIAKLRALGYKAEEAAKILKEMSKPIPGRSSSTSSTSAILK